MVVVHNFHVTRKTVFPNETNSPLIIKAASDALSARFAMVAGECYLNIGQIDDAVVNLEKGVKFVDRYSFIGMRPRWTMCYPMLVQAYIKQHQGVAQRDTRGRLASRRKLRKLLEKSHQWAEAYSSIKAPTFLAEGMYHQHCGDRATAEEKLQTSIQVAKDQDASLALSDSRLALTILNDAQ